MEMKLIKAHGEIIVLIYTFLLQDVVNYDYA